METYGEAWYIFTALQPLPNMEVNEWLEVPAAFLGRASGSRHSASWAGSTVGLYSTIERKHILLFGFETRPRKFSLHFIWWGGIASTWYVGH
jgi:hypothetical protein